METLTALKEMTERLKIELAEYKDYTEQVFKKLEGQIEETKAAIERCKGLVNKELEK